MIWVKIAYPSLKPLASWIRDLKERVKVLEKYIIFTYLRLIYMIEKLVILLNKVFINYFSWLKNGNPICFWMSGLYFP